MLISSFLPSTGGQGSEQRHFNSQAEGQDFWGKPFCMIIITKAAKACHRNSSNMELELASSLQHFQKASVFISSWHLSGLILRWRANLSPNTGALLLEVTFLKCTKFHKTCIPLWKKESDHPASSNKIIHSENQEIWIYFSFINSSVCHYYIHL